MAEVDVILTKVTSPSRSRRSLHCKMLAFEFTDPASSHVIGIEIRKSHTAQRSSDHVGVGELWGKTYANN